MPHYVFLPQPAPLCGLPSHSLPSEQAGNPQPPPCLPHCQAPPIVLTLLLFLPQALGVEPHLFPVVHLFIPMCDPRKEGEAVVSQLLFPSCLTPLPDLQLDYPSGAHPHLLQAWLCIPNPRQLRFCYLGCRPPAVEQTRTNFTPGQLLIPDGRWDYPQFYLAPIIILFPTFPFPLAVGQDS